MLSQPRQLGIGQAVRPALDMLLHDRLGPESPYRLRRVRWQRSGVFGCPECPKPFRPSVSLLESRERGLDLGLKHPEDQGFLGNPAVSSPFELAISNLPELS
jgi:hypothetical protein